MDLTTNHSVSAAEDLLDVLAAGGAGAPLRIATKSHGHAAGGEAAVAQAVITWAQAADRAELRTYAKDSGDSQIGDLPRRLVGLTAALVCDEAATASGLPIGPSLRRSALERLEILQGWRPRDGSRGPQIEILCADHLSKSCPVTLYEPRREDVQSVRPAKAFKDLAKVLLGTVMTSGMVGTMPQGLPDAIGDALYELFRNTHQHALTDVRGDHLRRSVRGIHARRHSLDPAVLSEMLEGSPPLHQYSTRRRARAGRRHVELVEFSVFDSGPGMAARWLGRETPDRQEELQAVTECFERHGSSQSNRGRGIGLPIVIAALRERNGFLRLRTGRQSLYADLGEEADAPFGKSPTLRAWPGGRPVARASGTLMTFLLPVEDAA